MNDFQYFHTYEALAAVGTVRPLACPQCLEELTVVRGSDDSPVLFCAYEDSLIIPGLDLIEQVRSIVKEHYL